MYSFRTTLGPVELAFTDRHGGVSGVPFTSLNLALGSDRDGDDDPASCARNLDLLLDDFAPGLPMADMSQVHGCDVARAEPGSPRPRADGLVTDRRDVVLLVRAADCVPVLLADPVVGVVGAVHAGRQGVVAGVVPATLQAMHDLGARDVVAWIGPHVCGGCYEVPVDLQSDVVAVVPESFATTTWGTPSLDLGAGVNAQLEAAGARVVRAVRCTRESPDLYSYRRDGRDSGRLAGVVRLRP